MKFLAQMALIFTSAACLMLAGSILFGMRQSQERKRPLALLLVAEFLIFVCMALVLLIHFDMFGSIVGYLIPAAGLTLIVNLPVVLVVWIVKKVAKSK
jgi:hypothetical protein